MQSPNGSNKQSEQSLNDVSSKASDAPSIKPIKKLNIVGIKNMMTAIIILIPKAFNASCGALSLFEITAFAKSILPNIISNNGTIILAKNITYPII